MEVSGQLHALAALPPVIKYLPYWKMFQVTETEPNELQLTRNVLIFERWATFHKIDKTLFDIRIKLLHWTAIM
jgi:hypothetical protein